MYFKVVGSHLRILGTMHVIPQGASIPFFVHAAAEWAEHICSEHESGPVIAAMPYPAGDRLDKHLPPLLIEKLDSVWKGSHPLRSLKPWAVMFQLPQSRMSMTQGAEAALMAHQANRGRAFSFIEHGSALTNALDQVSDGIFADALTTGLGELDHAQQRFLALYEAWAKKDEDAFFATVAKTPMQQRSELREAILTGRNRAWCETLLRTGQPARPTLLAVGALHLVGPGNLLDLLRAAGLNLQRVDPPV